MNGICIALLIEDFTCVNCFKGCSTKAITDINSLDDINLKFGYTLSITFISNRYVTISFQSLLTNCNFNLPYNVPTTYSLPVEGGTYCVKLTLTRNCCESMCCTGGLT